MPGNRQAQAAIAARAGVLHPLVADHAHLLRDDVELFAGLHTDLHQGGAIMGTDPFGIAEFMAHDVALQRGIQRLAAPLGALVASDFSVGFVVGAISTIAGFLLRWLRLGGCGQCLGLVEEHVLLMRSNGLAAGSKDLAHHLVERLLQQVALGPQKAVLADQ